jgi:glycolate oxidase
MPPHASEYRGSVSSVIEALRASLGAAVSVDPGDLDATRADKSGHISGSRPLAVVHARSVDDVQATMRIAHATGTPVVTRGAGTGLAGGAIASDGEIVLSTLAMNRVLEISRDDELAVIEPGIINADLNAQLSPHGLWFAPDPASRAISTVGGNIATNAGGLLCAKYGVTRDAVLGLKVVLADGRLLTLGHRTVKGVTGLDLTALMIGSEGTLGVIVEATVRLRPVQSGVVPTISATFANEDAASRAAAAIVSSGLHPSVMELIGGSAMAAIAAYLRLDHPGGSQLIVQTDGPGAEVEAQSALAIIASLGGVAVLSTDPAEGERLFAVRRSFHPAMLAIGQVLIEDVCVPRSQLPAMFGAIAGIEAKYGITIPTVAHAGDGNLHPNFVIPGEPGAEYEVPPEIWAAADELFLAALRLGGTLTGEHGIGILKRRWLRDELGDDQLELQRQIKAVFDPTGILNPGKVFGQESAVAVANETPGNTASGSHARR